MAFPTGKHNISYKHLSAKSPEALELLMLELLVNAPNVITFLPPTYANKEWFTWYMYEWTTELKGQDND